MTTFLSEETRDILGPQIELPVSGFAAMVDNIVLLRHVELSAQLRRLISVVKVRGEQTASSLRELSIDAAGIEISPTFDSAEAVLSGIARLSPAPPQAPNGKEGQVSAITEHPDLVLTDYMMPIANGSEMIRALRQMQEFRATPVVLMTASHLPKIVDAKGSPLKSVVLLGKPFLVDDVLEVIERLVGR